MIIAQIKKKENIVEYILYIRQIQDIIRAASFSIKTLDQLIICKYPLSNKEIQNVRSWYLDLILMMKQEELESGGDFLFIKNIIVDLEEVANSLENNPEEIKYAELYRWAKPNIEEFRNLSGLKNASDVMVCINAVHSLLLLRMNKQPISEETMQAMQTFSNLLAYVAAIYKKKYQ